MLGACLKIKVEKSVRTARHSRTEKQSPFTGKHRSAVRGDSLARTIYTALTIGIDDLLRVSGRSSEYQADAGMLVEKRDGCQDIFDKKTLSISQTM